MKTRIIQSHWDLNPLEIRIMTVADKWVRENKTTIPSRKVVEELNKDYQEPTVLAAMRRLSLKGYLRRTEYRPYSYTLLRTLPS